jgi:hypothetical protein
MAFGFLFTNRRGGRASRPVIARGLVLSIALLGSLSAGEMLVAAWIGWTQHFTAVPVGGLPAGDHEDPTFQFAPPTRQIDLRTDFPDRPGDRQIDLVVMGESSAEGVPYNRWVSIGKMVAWKLQEAIPGRHVELHVLARSGDTLEKQHQILSNLKRRPEVLIIYCGHNEFYSRLWWARNTPHYEVDQPLSRWNTITNQLSRFSSVCALLRGTANRCRIAIPPPADTSRSLVDVPNYTAREYQLLLTDFRRRLDELVTYADTVGALPILIVPPANDADFEPNRSFLPASTSPGERAAFAEAFWAARQLESADPETAAGRYGDLIARQPCFAETHYRLGKLMEQAGLWEDAYREFVAARDLDGMPMRCLSPFQQVYRDVASRHACILIDGQSYFHAIGRNGLLGDELFQDAMHPSLRGQIALAQATLVALWTRRAFGWPANAAAPVVDPAQSVAHFKIDKNAWREIALWWKGFNELMSPLRYDPKLRQAKRSAGIAAADKITAGVAPESLGMPNLGTPAPVPVLVRIPEPGPTAMPAAAPCVK